MKINNKNLTYTYDNSFANSLNTVDYEKNMKKSLTKTNEIWNKSYEDKWNTSNFVFEATSVVFKSKLIIFKVKPFS